MSHPVNDEILENLYEEIYGELSESYPDYSEATLDKMAGTGKCFDSFYYQSSW